GEAEQSRQYQARRRVMIQGFAVGHEVRGAGRPLPRPGPALPDRAAEFAFMGEHVTPNEIFRLDADDLVALELIDDVGPMLRRRRRWRQ
ncbi:MAG: hypothetical protein ACRDH5_00790, partial [bacterium]